LVVGPLSYAGLRDFGPPPQVPNWHGGYFYKSGAQLPPDVIVTVRIGPSAVRFAALVTEYGSATGEQAVTYQACASSKPAGYAWIGGFLLRGRRAGCVPIDVIVAGEANSRHAAVPLGVTRCR
jgi:hypothetical protein